jgi:hypothetical protein
VVVSLTFTGVPLSVDLQELVLAVVDLAASFAGADFAGAAFAGVAAFAGAGADCACALEAAKTNDALTSASKRRFVVRVLML